MTAEAFGHDFRLHLPLEWEDQTVYYFKGPDCGGMAHGITMTIDRTSHHRDIDRFAAVQIDAIGGSLQNIEVLEDENLTLEDGNPVYSFVYRWMPAASQPVYQKCVFVLRAGKAHTFSIGFNKKSFKIVGPRVEEVIEMLIPGTFSSPTR